MRGLVGWHLPFALALAAGLFACGSSAPGGAADVKSGDSAGVQEACSMLTHVGCQPTERCGELITPAGIQVGCAPAGTGAVGAACTSNTDCDRTTICESTSGKCLSVCDSSGAKSGPLCQAGTVCLAFSSPKATAVHLGACVSDKTCNPVTSEGCPADKQCLPASGALSAACFAVASGKQGEACAGNACAKGFICLGAKATCARICDASGALADYGCPAGAPCKELTLTGSDGKPIPNSHHLGFCPE